jgi:hypothetical protein
VRREINNGSVDSSPDDLNFNLDSYRSGFKSTQQLNIDFSQFKNHTFLSSARSKLDLALYKAINEYPFTGSKSGIDLFLAKLTGFERYVYDQIPKNKGYLFFSGTQAGESSGGTYIRVSPYSGNKFKDAPGATGTDALSIGKSPFEIETHLFLPEQANDNQVIAQRIDNGSSFTLAISQSLMLDTCKVLFLVSSASDSYVVSSGSITKGKFSHLRACLFNEADGKRSLIYSDGKLIASSSDIQDFGNISFGSSYLDIGSGSSHSILDYEFIPRQTLSGALDEFRIFKDQRSEIVAEESAYKEIFSTSSLQICFRFDEPSGSFTNNDYVLDYSGKCLHSKIENFSQNLRQTSSIASPLYLQNSYFSPVLYPDYEPFSILIDDLLTSASNYDSENPGIVTNLIPSHYLVESANAIGLSRFDDGIGTVPELDGIPGMGSLASVSPLMRMLILISVSLDEIKQFIDSMSNLLAIEPGDEDQISSKMFKYAEDYFGIELPNFFAKSTSDQFSFGQNVYTDQAASYTLRGLRDELWRRVLANMPYINSAKGTKSAVRAILLSSGIIPENFFVIREYGMTGEVRLSDLRDQTVEVKSILDFSSSFTGATGSIVFPGIRSDSPRIISPFLSGSRIEKGFPEIAGNFVNKSQFSPHGISNDPSDGLFTSGSFSIEASYVFDKSLPHPLSQSLFRLMTTGSAAPRTFLVANLIFKKDPSEDSGNIVFSIRPSFQLSAIAPDPMDLVLTGVNIFDGERWTIGVERERADQAGYLSSSYTIRCAKNEGNQVSFYTTSSFYSDATVTGASAFEKISTNYNASGSYLIIGSQSISVTPRLLNEYEDSIYTKFTGKVSSIRFYSTTTGDRSFIEHARNIDSTGLESPEIALGFDLVQTGAFQRIRIDASCDQATTDADSSGNIRIFDFSQNQNHLSGSGFVSNSTVIKPLQVTIDRISPRFDLQQVSNKVRVRGLNSVEETDPDYAITGPAYEIYDVNEIVDDVRFSIEHSIVKALNEDVISTIGDPDFIENSLGNTVSVFEDYYSDIDHFSSVYFNRLTGKIEISRTYEVFRWVDVALSKLVESVLPKRTKFLGINYVIEPHILERGKVRYRSIQSLMLSSPGSFDGVETESVIPD